MSSSSNKIEEAGISKHDPASTSFCNICMDRKTAGEMFKNGGVCGHSYCNDCIASYIAVKVEENRIEVKCPDANCDVVIGPDLCRSVIPKEVMDRWEMAICESLIPELEKFYCPYNDCSALLVDDGGEAVTASECPNCRRLFCAQCKVSWHSGLECGEYQSLRPEERLREDMMLMELAKEKEWKRCPRCRFVVERTEGCLYILCRCGYEFCYGCGSAAHSSHDCPHAQRN